MKELALKNLVYQIMHSSIFLLSIMKFICITTIKKDIKLGFIHSKSIKRKFLKTKNETVKLK